VRCDCFDRMRKARGTIRTVSLTPGTALQLVGPSSIRVSLTFFGATAAYTLGGTSNVTAGQGVVVPANSATPVLWTVQYHGDLVQQGVYVIAGSATDVTFIETILQGE